MRIPRPAKGQFVFRVCLAACALHFSCMPNYRQEAINNLTPESTFSEDQRRSGRACREMPIRVWADQEVAKVVRWDRRIENYVARANNGLAVFGVCLRITKIIPWQRKADAADAVAMLDELRERDDGEGVEWVMGVVAATSGLYSKHGGMAMPYSKHFIMREAADAQEYDAIVAADTDLTKDDIDTIYKKRMAHRSAAYLLHEWAHTLGALHTRSSQWIMSPTYSIRELEFSEVNRKIIALVLEHRIDRTETLTWLKAHRDQLAKLDTSELIPEEHAGQLAYIERAIASMSRVPAETRNMDSLPGSQIGAASDLSPAEAEAINASLRLAMAGRADQGLAAVEAALAKHPDDPQVLGAACTVHLGANRTSEATGRFCRQAVERDPGCLSAQVNLASHLDATGKRSEALVHAAKAAGLVAAETPERTAVQVAALHMDLDCPCRAKQIASRFPENPDAKAIVAKADQTIMRSGLHPLDAVPAAARPDYILRMRQAYVAFTEHKPRRAARMGSELHEEFPGVAGPLVVLCEAHRLQGKLRQARRECQQALDIHPQACLAHFGLGLINLMQNRYERAKVHLERAITLDPDFSGAYAMLAVVHKNTRNRKGLEDLRKRFRTHFSMRPGF